MSGFVRFLMNFRRGAPRQNKLGKGRESVVLYKWVREVKVLGGFAGGGEIFLIYFFRAARASAEVGEWGVHADGM
jgi:hypothetical protein